MRFEDSNGRFIEAAEDAAEAMRAMVESLKGSTKKTSSFGGGGLADAIKKLPEEFVKRLSKELKDFKKIVEDIRDFTEKVSKKRSGMGGAGSSGRSGMGGAGSSGRRLPGASRNDFRQEKANMSIVEGMTKELLNYMNRTRRSSKSWGHDMSYIASSASEIKTEMERINGGIVANSKEHDKLITKHEKEAKYLEEMSSMWDQLSATERSRLKILMRELADLKKQKASAEEIVDKYNEILNASKQIHDKHHLIWGTLKHAAAEAGKMAGHLTSVFSGMIGAKYLGSFFDNLKEGAIDSKKMSGTMLSLMRNDSWAKPGEYYQELFKTNSKMISEVGQPPHIMKREWAKAIKKGTRGLEDMRDTMNDGLGLAYQLDASAEGTADEFQKWNMHLGLGSKQTANLARNIRQAASDIGVFGDEMMRAVSSAREIAKEIRKAGFDAENVAEQLIRMQASGEKFGVGKELSEIQRVLGGGLSGFKDASSTMKNLMAQSGNIPGIISGQTASGAGMKDASNRIAQMLKKEIAAAGGVGPDGVINLSKIPDEMKSKLDFIFKQRFGKDFGLGSAAIIVEAIEDANTSNEDKLSKLENELKTNNSLTDKERKALEENIATQKSKIGQANLNKALEKISRAKTGEEMAKLKTEFETSINSVNEKLAKAGKTQLNQKSLMEKYNKAAAMGNDEGFKQMKEVRDAIEDGDKLANTSLKSNSNLVLRSEMLKFKAQGEMQNAIGTIIEQLGFLGEIAILVGSIAASMLGLLQMRVLISIAKRQLGVNEKLTNKALHRGSIYTHDIHAEKILHLIARKQGVDIPGGGVVSATGKNKKKSKGKSGGVGKNPMGMLSGVMGGAMFGPIGIVIGLLTTLLSLIFANSEKLQEVFGKLMETFTPIFQLLGDVLADVIIEMMPFITELMSAFVEILKEIKPVLKYMIMYALLPAIALFKVLAFIFKNVFIPVIKTIKSVWESVFQPIWEKLKVIWEKLANFWTGTLKPIWDAIYGAFEKLCTAFKEAIDWVLRQANRVNPLTDAGDVDEKGKPVERSWVERRARNMNPFTGGGILSGLNPFDKGPGTFEKNNKGTWTNLKEGNIWGSIKSIFADGGIVGSNKDGEAIPVIAHANEWVLNGDQQNKLLDGVNAMTTFKQALMRSSLNGLDERVQRDVQGSRPSASMSAANEELVQIAVNTERMVQIGVDQVKLLNELIDTFNTGKESTTSSRPKTRVPPNYHTWRAGRYGDTATKQFVNNG